MSVATLRQEARKSGVPVANLRGLTSEAEIREAIDNFLGKSAKPVAKKKGRTVAKKKTSSTPARKAPGRKSAGRKPAPAKSTKKSGTAKRQTTARRASDAGRNLLEDVDFNQTDGWNPREGSAPDTILRALKKARGNRSKAFDALVPDLWDFVNKKDSNGNKITKAKGEWLLRYRISRTLWDFAKKTGQHEPSQNRATYGEGGTGIGVSGGMPVAFRPEKVGKPVFKRAKSRKTTARKATGATRTAKKTTAKRGATPKRGKAGRKATARGRK